MKAKAAMAEDAKESASCHLCCCELNLLGDPSLDMRATSPCVPNLKVPSEIGIGSSSTEVVTDAPSSTICVWKGTEIYQVITADRDGNATISVYPKTEGDIEISVTGANLNSVVAKISVTVDNQ